MWGSSSKSANSTEIENRARAQWCPVSWKTQNRHFRISMKQIVDVDNVHSNILPTCKILTQNSSYFKLCKDEKIYKTFRVEVFHVDRIQYYFIPIYDFFICFETLRWFLSSRVIGAYSQQFTLSGYNIPSCFLFNDPNTIVSGLNFLIRSLAILDGSWKSIIWFVLENLRWAPRSPWLDRSPGKKKSFNGPLDHPIGLIVV